MEISVSLNLDRTSIHEHEEAEDVLGDDLEDVLGDDLEDVLGDDLEDDPDEIVRILGSRGTERRETVMGEQYNPEEDNDDDIKVSLKSDEERRRIKQRTNEIFLFRALDDQDLGAVIDAMVPKYVEKSTVIIKQGDDGDFFYLIDNGDFDIFKNRDGVEEQIGRYEGQGFFGELALLHNQPREATIIAATDGFLWAVGRKAFNKLIAKRAFQKRMMYMELLNEFEQLRLLTEYERMQVADALSAKSYHVGDAIVNEGDGGDGMYFIVEGKVSVRKKQVIDGQSQDIEISQLGKGGFFGELALVKHQPRAATVIAIEHTETAFLDVSAFERLLGPCMDIIERHGEAYE